MNRFANAGRSGFYRPEPVWIPRRRLYRLRVPVDVLRWLLDTASLTRRIQSVCSGMFRVQVLAQAWARPMANEARALGLRADAWALVRQVQLLCDETPWIYARTVVPRKTLSGRTRRLGHLQSRSLGAMLFADPTMSRSEVEIARITPEDMLYPLTVSGLHEVPAEIWGRRSLFTIHGKRLLVSEIFLPAIAGKRF